MATPGTAAATCRPKSSTLLPATGALELWKGRPPAEFRGWCCENLGIKTYHSNYFYYLYFITYFGDELWTSIWFINTYQLFWSELQGYRILTHIHIKLTTLGAVTQALSSASASRCWFCNLIPNQTWQRNILHLKGFSYSNLHLQGIPHIFPWFFLYCPVVCSYFFPTFLIWLGVETAIQEQLIEAFHWPSLRQWLGSAEKRHQTPRVFQESVVTDCELRWMRLADLAAGCLLLEGCAHAVVVDGVP